jgi:hypothetical protein
LRPRDGRRTIAALSGLTFGGREMRERGGRLLRVAVIWTLLMLAIAVLLAAQAMYSLYEGEQACFFNYPAVACPASDDPAVTRLTFAFFGVPVVWLVGIGLVILAWAWRRRRGATPR